MTRRRLAVVCIFALLEPVAVVEPVSAEIRISVEGEARASQSVGVAVDVLGSGDFALGDASPRAWLIADPQGPCAQPAAGLSRSELDGWLLILRNSDNTVSAVEPERHLASSNIVWIRPFEGEISGWEVDGSAGIARVWSLTAGTPSAGTLNLSDGSLARQDGTDLGAPLSSQSAVVRSALARQSFRLSDDRSAILAIPDDPGAATGSIPLHAPAERIEASLNGRWLMALSPQEGLVQVVDVAVGRLRHAFAIHAGFTRTAFSADYLYLREADRPYVSMIRLDSLAERDPDVLAIPVGLTASADAMVPVGAAGMAFLHAGERAVYLYMESGMADNHGAMRSPTAMLAPYDVVRLRGSRPVDLAVYDRSLRQVGPGRFRSTITPAHGGPWRIVVRDGRRDQLACHDFTVGGSPAERTSSRPLRLEKLDETSPRFRIVGAQDERLPERIAMLAMVPGSNWQRPVTAFRQVDGTFLVGDTLPLAARISLVPTDLPMEGASLSIGPLR